MTEEKDVSQTVAPPDNVKPKASIPDPKKANHALRAIVIIAVIGLAIWVWDANKYRVFPKRFGAVIPGQIYRSGQLHPDLVERTLEKNGIEVVISLTGDVTDDPDIIAEKAAVEKIGIEFHRFPLHGDGTGNLEHYVQAIQTMLAAQAEGKTVLVHCAAGSQRTGGAIAFYRLLIEGKSPEFVYHELRQYDWRDKPDAALLPYINEHLPAMAQRLLELGIIDKIPDPLPRLTSKHDPEFKT